VARIEGKLNLFSAEAAGKENALVNKSDPTQIDRILEKLSEGVTDESVNKLKSQLKEVSLKKFTHEEEFARAFEELQKEQEKQLRYQLEKEAIKRKLRKLESDKIRLLKEEKEKEMRVLDEEKEQLRKLEQRLRTKIESISENIRNLESMYQVEQDKVKNRVDEIEVERKLLARDFQMPDDNLLNLPMSMRVLATNAERKGYYAAFRKQLEEQNKMVGRKIELFNQRRREFETDEVRFEPVNLVPARANDFKPFFDRLEDPSSRGVSTDILDTLLLNNPAEKQRLLKMQELENQRLLNMLLQEELAQDQN